MSQTIEIPDLPSGEAGMTANLSARGTDTSVKTGLALTELTNGKGHFRCTATTTATGWHVVSVYYSDATHAGSWLVYLTNTSAVHYAADTDLDVLAAPLTEGYRATGATGSIRDLLYEILQNLTEFALSGTTKTVKKLDGSATAKTYTLDSSSAPTSITETT